MLALAGGAMVAVAAGGCGGDDGDARVGGLEWERPPRLLRPATLPRDRILHGRVRNDSLRPLELEARDLRLVDRAGRAVDGDAVFLGSFIHGIYSPRDVDPERLPDSERIRTGRLAQLNPGETVALTVAWRLPRGGSPPVRVRYPGGALPLPRR